MNNEEIEQNLIQNCFVETYKHVKLVSKNINVFIKELIYRSENHDNSKFEEPELSIYAKFTPELAKTEYGSKEYKELLEKVRPAIDHHYAKNSHHIEYFKFQEEWRDVKGYEGCYQVSNYGQVKSTTRMLKREYNNDLFHEGKLLNPHLTPSGYLRLQLQKDGIGKNYLVHRLVAETFIENPQNKKSVNHKNGIRTDNHIANLEWVTHSENLIEAYDYGAKFSNAKYVVICEELDLVTIGVGKMERALRKLGYDRAESSSIFKVLDSENYTHLDLHFTSYNLQEIKESIYVNRMDLIDLMELLADWAAAIKRSKNGNLLRSIKINSEKYSFDKTITNILENTARKYFPEVTENISERYFK